MKKKESRHMNCIICLDTDEKEIFISSPCCCKGSMKNIHKNCLIQKRINSQNDKICNTCKQHYRIRDNGFFLKIKGFFLRYIIRSIDIILLFSIPILCNFIVNYLSFIGYNNIYHYGNIIILLTHTFEIILVTIFINSTNIAKLWDIAIIHNQLHPLNHPKIYNFLQNYNIQVSPFSLVLSFQIFIILFIYRAILLFLLFFILMFNPAPSQKLIDFKNDINFFPIQFNHIEELYWILLNVISIPIFFYFVIANTRDFVNSRFYKNLNKIKIQHDIYF